jgi:hypothetical protein
MKNNFDHIDSAVLDPTGAMDVDLLMKEVKAAYSKSTGIIFPTMEIDGEDFQIFRSDSGIILQHPKWALRGEGKTLFEAIQSLRRNIHDKKMNIVRLSLTPDFRSFILNF